MKISLFTTLVLTTVTLILLTSSPVHRDNARVVAVGIGSQQQSPLISQIATRSVSEGQEQPANERRILSLAHASGCDFPTPRSKNEQRNRQEKSSSEPIDLELATKYFRQAKSIFEKDGGKFWGKKLTGPMIFVDPRSRRAVANQQDKNGTLKKTGDVFVGAIPTQQMVANTSVEWSGTRWTMLLWPLPNDNDERSVLLAHEAWHRIQNELGFPSTGASNAHLDTFDGRYWLQLEWRALASALEKNDQAAIKQAVTDALAFRKFRYQKFNQAKSQERLLELHEGLAEYTGVRIGLSRQKAKSRTIGVLKNRPKRLKTFVRSFAYLSGPAYGLLLDRAKPDWRSQLNSKSDLTELLQTALRIEIDRDLKRFVDRRSQVYGGQSLLQAEKQRQQKRDKLTADYTRRFVSGQTVTLPLAKMRMSFNPNELFPLKKHGTVYPTITLSDSWGVLKTKTGALISSDFRKVVVELPASAKGKDKQPALDNECWVLKLNSGWHIEKSKNGYIAVKK